MARDIEKKRQYDRERMRTIKAAARGELPKLPPLEEHRLVQSLKAEKEKFKTTLSELSTYQAAVEALSHLTAAPLPAVKRYEFTSGLRDGTAIAMLSDTHVEEEVRLGETPYPNMYNQEIAERSLARFFNGFLDLVEVQRQIFKIRTAVVWLGGDLMTGHIHEENIETTRGQTPIETSLWLLPRLKAGINRLLEDNEFEQIQIPCSYGNHGRNTKKPMRARGAVHSYEWLMYQTFANEFRSEPRVKFLSDQSAHQYARVYDFDLHFHHGDETNYNGGSGGIMIPLNKSVAQWDMAKRCHYHHFGHWHQYIDTKNVTTNGSMIGFNAYAMSIKATPEDPQQAFYVLDSKRGKTAKYPIWVREASDIPIIEEAA